MNEQAYWDKLLEKNPALRRDIVTLKSLSFRSIVEQAWEKGYNHNPKHKPRTAEEELKDTELGKVIFGNKNKKWWEK